MSVDREAMHRRAQQAEGRLQRVMWWIDAGIHAAEQEAKTKKCWPLSVPLFYLRNAAEEYAKGKPVKQGRNDLSEWEPFGGWRKRPPAPTPTISRKGQK